MDTIGSIFQLERCPAYREFMIRYSKMPEKRREVRDQLGLRDLEVLDVQLRESWL